MTGLILNDLRRVAGDRHFVDGVVAENGTVITFRAPVTRRSWRHPFRRPLWRGSGNWAFHSAGRCLVDAGCEFCTSDTRRDSRARTADRAVVQPQRVMALAEGGSKATGLGAALIARSPAIPSRSRPTPPMSAARTAPDDVVTGT